MDSALFSLTAVFAAIALAPLLAAWLKRFMSVPLPVVEITLGIIIGPAVLGLADPGGLPHQLGRMGLAAIVFIAGYELDYRRISRRQFGWASGGWLLSLVLAVLAGLGVVAAASAGGLTVAGRDDVTLVTTGVFVGIALTSTALSTAMPALRDANETTTPYGRAIIASGAVGQLAPLLALSVVFGGRDIWWSVVALVVFGVLLWAAMRISSRGLPGWARRVVTATMHSSGHFAVRLVVVVIALLAATSVEVFDVDMLIGAFAAGVLVRQLLGSVEHEDRVLTEHKFQGLAFGLLTPMFFVSTGIAFDLRGLIAQPLALLLVPVFIVVMFLARGLPGSLVLPRESSARDRVAAMFWTSVGLAVVVAVVDIAVREGAVDSVLGSAMVGAGMVSLLAFPTLALAVRPQPQAGATAGPAPGGRPGPRGGEGGLPDDAPT